MASKSKKRRRVLGASCILAALIIAGSSFAWFTSKDEVTNRLSANADYGVSIVESFAPPENWLPGQEVNKDVYAVNTGNVAAFVEETVSGVLTITKEVKDGAGKAYADDTADVPVTPNADDIKLTKAEVYVIEDGSYLALAPKASSFKAGDKIVAMNPDSENLDGYTALTGDFGPDAAGLYVFRRSIDVDSNTQIETFKYDAYYYDGQDFYKVTDLKVVPDTVSYAGDNDKTDGNLKSATYSLVKEESKTVDPVSLTYEDAVTTGDNQHPKRLVATYDTGATYTNDQLNALGKAYDDALIVYNDAVDEYTAALNDDDAADAAVQAANSALQTALNNQKTKANNLAKAEQDLQDALAAKAATAAALQAATDALTAAQTAATNAGTALGASGDAANNGANASAWAKYNYAKAQTQAAKDALGEENATASNDADASAYAKLNYAKQQATNAKNSMGEDGRKAYLKYVREHVTSTDISGYTDEQTETWLDENATYDELNGLGIDNNGDVGYDYHQKLMLQKQAERNVETAKKAVSDAEAAERSALQAKNDAQAAKDAADAALGTAADTADDDTAYGRKAKAQAADDEAAAQLGTSGDASNVDTAYGRLKKAQEEKAAADTALGNPGDTASNAAGASAYAQYNYAVNAATGNPSTSTKLKTAKENLAAATQALAEAEEAFNDAMESSNGKLKININLSDDVVTTTTGNAADKWEHFPIASDDSTAYFYYTGILGAGETSSKLIDSVELDKSVTNDMFKRFDFDLNVALKSAQIAYDADGNVTADATTELDAKAVLPASATTDSAVNWTLK